MNPSNRQYIIDNINEYNFEKNSDMEICRNYGSARGCRYRYNCYYSHDHPESVKLCRFVLKNKWCRAGNQCQFRHIMYEYEKQSNEATVIIRLLLNLFVEYYKHRETDKTQFNALWKDKRNKNEKYCYKAVTPSKLLTHLVNNNGHGLIADIGLFVQKKSSYSNNNWHEWIKSDNEKYLALSRDEQTKIIIKIRELINYYNANYKYMTKKFHPWTYYRTKIIVYGFINNLIRNQLESVQFCPLEIMKLCLKFYYNVAKYKLFEYTSTVKISDDNTLIQTKRRLTDYLDAHSLCLPFIVYRILNFKLFKIKCVSIPKNLTFSIGIIDRISHIKNVKNHKNLEFWPFNLTEKEKASSSMQESVQFCFGDKNDQRRKINANDTYCDVLCDGDILTLESPKKRWNHELCRDDYVIHLSVKSKNKKIYTIRLPDYLFIDRYPAMAFAYCLDHETKIQILNVECDDD